MSKVTIEKKKFKELYDIACDSWKTKFNKILQSFVFSDTLEFDEKFVQEMKSACTTDQKPVFDKLFKGVFKEFNYTKIKSYKDACYGLGIKELVEHDFKALPDDQVTKVFAYHKLQTIAKALNNGWVPDWDNGNQYKFYPWFEKRSCGWVFSFSFDLCSGSDALPACYFSREVSDYAGKTFIDIYKDLL